LVASGDIAVRTCEVVSKHVPERVLKNTKKSDKVVVLTGDFKQIQQ